MGGLIHIHPSIRPFFLDLEILFRKLFDNCNGTLSFEQYLEQVHKADLSTPLLERLQKVDASEPLIERVLYGLLKTFFNVRINHECRIFMDQYRKQNKKTRREKSLRKTLN